jgi:hypothetical protein
MVVSYMEQRRSIILAVIAADNPFHNQTVTAFARNIDKLGTRTLGLITKPDKLDKGSASEEYYGMYPGHMNCRLLSVVIVDLTRNNNVKLILGWHMLRNKSTATADDTAAQRDQREKEFFSDNVWSQALNPSQLGIDFLRQRLRDVLWKQIQEGLPGVKYEVQLGIKDCSSKLAQLGKARSTFKEKHAYLHRIGSELSTMMRAAIDGVYANPFFASYPRRQDA